MAHNPIRRQRRAGRPAAQARGRGGTDRGSATVELAVVAPAVLALVGLVVFAGRIETAHQAVTQAASDAARAATLTRSITGGPAAARTAVAADLGEGDCATWDVTVSGLVVPGGVITVHVTCTTGLGIVPGVFTASASASATVDAYRGVAP